MDYIIKGDSDCPIAEIHLQTHETVKIERGSMAYMSNVSIEGKMNSNKKAWEVFLEPLEEVLQVEKACLLQKLQEQVPTPF